MLIHVVLIHNSKRDNNVNKAIRELTYMLKVGAFVDFNGLELGDLNYIPIRFAKDRKPQN